MKRYSYLILLLALLGACAKSKISPKGDDPYKEQVLPAIYFNKGGIDPVAAKAGDLVMVAGKGFLKNKDKLSFLFNGVKAEIVEMTDTSARVKVPAQAASGNIAAQVDQQYFFGPFFRVQGVFEMDTLFPSKVAANGSIEDLIPVEDGKYLIVGNFTDFDGSGKQGGQKRVARINHDGKLDRAFGPDNVINGTNTAVYAAAMLPGNKYLVAGGFNNYEGVNYVNSIAQLNNNGSLAVNKINAPSGKEVTVSVLKGGVAGRIDDLSVQADGKILVTGNFRFYVQPNFNLVGMAGQDSVHLDSIQVNGLVRLMPDGGIDSTYNYDHAMHMGKEGGNGYIYRSFLLPDGKLLVAGGFTKFNGQTANRLVRLNTDGSVDPTFTIGAGADQAVVDIARQADGKIVLVGGFNSFGGLKAPRAARINADGTVDPTFNIGTGSNGYFGNVGFMPGGEIILSGNFTEFNGLQRNNVIVLNPNGSVHPAYNSNGGITADKDGNYGYITRVLPQQGEKSLLVVGSFTKFDFRDANRVVRITYP